MGALRAFPTIFILLTFGCGDSPSESVLGPSEGINPLFGLTLLRVEDLTLGEGRDMLQMGEDTWIWTRSYHGSDGSIEIVGESHGIYTIDCHSEGACNSIWTRLSGKPSVWNSPVVYNEAEGLYRIGELLYRTD
jgi:hypothetical protein